MILPHEGRSNAFVDVKLSRNSACSASQGSIVGEFDHHFGQAARGQSNLTSRF